MNTILQSDDAVLRDFGERLSQRRIQTGLTQAALARQAGVGRSTVERMESGHSTQLSSLIRVLRVLGLLQAFRELMPSPELSPMQLVSGQRKIRKRASARRSPAQSGDAAWKWADDS